MPGIPLAPPAVIGVVCPGFDFSEKDEHYSRAGDRTSCIVSETEYSAGELLVSEKMAHFSLYVTVQGQHSRVCLEYVNIKAAL